MNTDNTSNSVNIEALANEVLVLTGYKFKNLVLLQQALTHPSVSHGSKGSYERLEFVGDAVLGVVVSEMLYRLFPDDTEGCLTKRKVALVCGQKVVEVAQYLNLGRVMILSARESVTGGATNNNNLENLLEALIGAIYMDSGIKAAKCFISKLWKPLAQSMSSLPQDPKTALQEWSQSRNLAIPHYKVISKTGAEHNPFFTVEVTVKNHGSAVATGTNKKSAEKNAALLMLKKISTISGNSR